MATKLYKVVKDGTTFQGRLVKIGSVKPATVGADGKTKLDDHPCWKAVKSGAAPPVVPAAAAAQKVIDDAAAQKVIDDAAAEGESIL